MSIFNFLKNKKKAEKAKESATPKRANAEVQREIKKETPKIIFEGVGFSAVKVLKQPHITEKANYLTGKDKYVFKVYRSANKTEIKKVIENLYKTEVLSVNMVNIPSKKKRTGKGYSVKSGYRKAIVTLPRGKKIDILAR